MRQQTKIITMTIFLVVYRYMPSGYAVFSSEKNDLLSKIWYFLSASKMTSFKNLDLYQDKLKELANNIILAIGDPSNKDFNKGYYRAGDNELHVDTENAKMYFTCSQDYQSNVTATYSVCMCLSFFYLFLVSCFMVGIRDVCAMNNNEGQSIFPAQMRNPPNAMIGLNCYGQPVFIPVQNIQPPSRAAYCTAPPQLCNPYEAQLHQSASNLDYFVNALKDIVGRLALAGPLVTAINESQSPEEDKALLKEKIDNLSQEIKEVKEVKEVVSNLEGTINDSHNDNAVLEEITVILEKIAALDSSLSKVSRDMTGNKKLVNEESLEKIMKHQLEIFHGSPEVRAQNKPFNWKVLPAKLSMEISKIKHEHSKIEAMLYTLVQRKDPFKEGVFQNIFEICAEQKHINNSLQELQRSVKERLPSNWDVLPSVLSEELKIIKGANAGMEGMLFSLSRGVTETKTMTESIQARIKNYQQDQTKIFNAMQSLTKTQSNGGPNPSTKEQIEGLRKVTSDNSLEFTNQVKKLHKEQSSWRSAYNKDAKKTNDTLCALRVNKDQLNTCMNTLNEEMNGKFSQVLENQSALKEEVTEIRNALAEHLVMLPAINKQLSEIRGKGVRPMSYSAVANTTPPPFGEDLVAARKQENSVRKINNEKK